MFGNDAQDGQLAILNGGHSLDNFPNELLERIIFYCDGVTVKRCSAVSRRFRESVVNVSKLRRVWKKCVVSEIESDVIQELNRNHVVNETTDAIGDQSYQCYLDDPYYKLFTKWYRTFKIGVWPSTATPINGFLLNPVTCVKVSGDLIIMGHKDGCVSICDYLSNNFEIACRHIRMVTDLALIDLAGKSEYSIYESRKGAVSHHHHVVSISKDQTLWIYPIQSADKMSRCARIGFRPAKDAELLHVRVFGKYCAVYASNTKITIWEMSMPDSNGAEVADRLNFTLLCVTVPPDSLPGWFSLWENKIRCLCPETGVLSEYFVDKLRWSGYRRALQLKAAKANDYLKFITRVFLLRRNLIILVTAGGTVLHSTDGEKLNELLVHKNFTSKVSAITMWGAIVVFGLESGELVIYRCPTTEEISSLHKRKPIFRRKLHADRGQEPIIGLDVDDYGDGTVIVATSANAVSVLKWRHTYQRC